MSADPDYMVAMRLHQKLNSNENIPQLPSKKESRSKKKTVCADRKNVEHLDWEVADPTPDIQSLFLEFDAKFFQNRLKLVSLEWNKCLHSCTGICYLRKNHHDGEITISLSKSLLKLRHRKNLIECLLHEMIHAYCFLMNIHEANGGHGTNFKKIMHAINKVAGTDITVYHTLRNNDLHQQHVWHCNGICQNRAPFYGYIRHSTNSSPGPNDQWWMQHQQTCGGCFKKIDAPTPRRFIKRGKKTKSNVFVCTQIPQNSNNLRNGMKLNGSSSTIKTTNLTTSKTTHTAILTADKNLQNFATTIPDKSVVDKKFGRGYSLKNAHSNNNDHPLDPENLRRLRLKRFKTNNQSDDINKTNEETEQNTAKRKRRKLGHVNEILDDNLRYLIKTRDINVSSGTDDDGKSINVSGLTKPPTLQLSIDERQAAIKREILADSKEKLSIEDIILIDDEYDDRFADTFEPTIASVIDEFFGEDTLLKDYNIENGISSSATNYRHRSADDIITCPICEGKMKRSEFDEHICGCTGIVKRIEPSLSVLDLVTSPTRRRAAGLQRKSQQENINATQTRSSIQMHKPQTVGIDWDDPHYQRKYRQRGLYSPNRQCPLCAEWVVDDEMNLHLTKCTVVNKKKRGKKSNK